MTGLLELKEKLKLIYSKNDVFILPIVKFLLAFVVFSIINDRMGYMTVLDNIAVVLIVALLCSFMPTGAIMFFAAVFSLAHMYALSMEVALVGLVVYVLLYLLFLRFCPKDLLTVVLTPVLCGLQIPYVMPVAMGLLGTPASAVSVSCGVVIYYVIQTITANASTISTMDAEDATAKIRLIIDGIIDNRTLLVMVTAFAITVVVVYLIRRMSVDHSWTIAIVAGVMVDLVILLIGDLVYDTNMSVVNAMIGTVIAIIAGKIIEFFRFCVDYSRTERVQFEDDEYYYYVKAVPKMTVAAPTNTVKKINTQRSTSSLDRSTTRTTSGSGRSVTMERTSSARGSMYNGQAPYGGRQRDYMNNARSVTISSDGMTEDAIDDYEELF